MKKKILIVNPVHQFGYGAGYYYYSKYLKDLFDIDFLGFDKGLPDIDLPGIKNIRLKLCKNRIINLLYFSFFAIKLTKKSNYDGIFCVYFNFAFLLGLLTKSKFKVLDIRTGSLSNKLMVKCMANTMILFTSLFFDKVTILSLSLSKLLHIPVSKRVLLPLGSDIIYDGSKKYHNNVHLIYVGILQMRAIGTTIEGFWHFYNKYKDKISLKYDIVGFSPDKKDEEDIQYKIKKFGLQEIVRFHGLKTHNELKYLFKEATIGVCFVPQIPQFQFQPSTKIFEYVLSGLITIATDTYENRRFVSSINGIICQDNAASFCDGLETIYLNFNKYRDNTIRKSLMQYHWNAIVNETLKPLFLGNRS